MGEDPCQSASDIRLFQIYCLSEALDDLRKPEHADVTLICRNVEFPAHQVVLKANSPYFVGMFGSDMKEASSGEAVFDDMEPETLGIALDFMYLGDVSKINNDSCALDVLAASHMIQLEKLFEYCCKYLVKKLTTQNFHDVWNVGLKYDRQDISREVLFYMLANINEVVLAEEFLILSREKVRDILKVTNPQVIDEVLFGLVKWFCHDWDERVKYVGDLLAYLNPQYISENTVKLLLENESVTIPGQILTKMKQLGWPVTPRDQNLAQIPVDECDGIRLVFFSEFQTEKQFDHSLKPFVNHKVPGCCIQSLDLHKMTWLPHQKLPDLKLKGSAMCQHRDKICMVGGNLKSFYVMYDVATNAAEYVNCSVFDANQNGILHNVKDQLYFVERSTNGKLRRVVLINPGESSAVGVAKAGDWPSATTVASKDYLFIYYTGKESTKCSCRISITEKGLKIENLEDIRNIPESSSSFFVVSDNYCYGFYEANGDLVRLKYDAIEDNWVAKVFPKCPADIREVTSVYCSSEDKHSLVFVSTGSKPYGIPDYLLDLETCKWVKLPQPKGHECIIPEDEVVQKVYFVDSYH